MAEVKTQPKAGQPRAEKTEKLAVIMTGGKQYIVREGDTLKVEKLDAEVGETVTFDTVLLLADGADVTVGTPRVAKASVKAEVLEQGRADKVIILKFKNKVRYTGKRGHRQNYTKLMVKKIG